VVTDLVGQDVGLREVARCTVALAQVVVEAEVDVDALIRRTVEGPHRGLTETAGGPHRPAVEDQFRLLVLPAARREQGAPGVLGIGEHHRHELL